MKLYLVQHGQSLPKEVDPKQPLSEEGRVNTERIGEFLKMKDIRVDSIWRSAKLRAIETAEIIAHYLENKSIIERDDLNPLDPVDKFPEEITKLDKSLVIVGHLPFLQKLASLLLTGSPDFELVSFMYSGVVCLECKERWKIAWFLTPPLAYLPL